MAARAAEVDSQKVISGGQANGYSRADNKVCENAVTFSVGSIRFMNACKWISSGSAEATLAHCLKGCPLPAHYRPTKLPDIQVNVALQMTPYPRVGVIKPYPEHYDDAPSRLGEEKLHGHIR